MTSAERQRDLARQYRNHAAALRRGTTKDRFRKAKSFDAQADAAEARAAQLDALPPERQSGYTDAGTGFRGGDTSREAALKVGGKAATVRAAVLAALRAHGPQTAPEVAERTGYPVTSVRSRITELANDGKATDTGTRRKGEHHMMVKVWAAVDAKARAA